MDLTSWLEFFTQGLVQSTGETNNLNYSLTSKTM